MRFIINKDAHRKVSELRKQVPRLPGCKYETVRVFDRDLIRELLTKGMSLSNVVRRAGCSTGTVQLVRKQMRLHGLALPRGIKCSKTM